jgi:hypothetical protein
MRFLYDLQKANLDESENQKVEGYQGYEKNTFHRVMDHRICSYISSFGLDRGYRFIINEQQQQC